MSSAQLVSGAVCSEHEQDLEAVAAAANNATTATGAPLLSDAARSEHDLDLEAVAAAANTTTANTAMHPITGAFADPSLEVAFAAQLFHIAFPVHTLLLAIMFAIRTSLVTTDQLAHWIIFELVSSLALVGRVLVHRMHDKARGQQLGSWTWTALTVVACTANEGSYIVAPATTCEALRPGQYMRVPLMFLAFTLTNASHGLSFFHKLALIVCVLVDSVVVITFCGEGSSVMKSAIGVTVLGSVCAHVAELQLRRSYHRVQENEGLAAEDSFRNSNYSNPSDSPPPSLPPGAPSSRSSASETKTPPLTWTEADRIDPQWLAAQGATQLMGVEELVLARSSQSSTGFEGVYASAGGFGAELQKGAKRLRQDGFRSPVEAALERSRWVLASVESAEENRAPLAAAEASSGREQQAAEALAGMAKEKTVMQQRVYMPQAQTQLGVPKPVLAMPVAPCACSQDPGNSEVVSTMPAASSLTTGSFLPLPAPPLATSYVPPRRPASPHSTPVPPAKKIYMTAYTKFCQEQRPHLPTNLFNAEREKTLGARWKALSRAEKDRYNVQVGAPSPAPSPTL